MTPKNAQKPSLIILLAPLAIIVIGYQLFFHSKMQRDLQSRRRQVQRLAPAGGDGATNDETAKIFSLTKSANDQITAAEAELADAEAKFATLEQQRKQLLAIILGQANGELPAEEFPLAASGSQAATLVSTSSFPTGVIQADSADDAPSAMMRVCEICAEHGLKRVSNHISRDTKARRFEESQRQQLSKLLGETLPAPVYFELELNGSFLNLIDALHEMSQHLPMVRIQSVSMDEAEPTDATRRWTLSLGFTGS